jgi:hypothetical protein
MAAIIAQGVRVIVLPEEQIIAELRASAVPAIIATPSSSHFAYVVALHSAGVRYALEKPLSNIGHEIRAIAEGANYFKPSMFALGYYSLEKALPVTYLMQPNHHFSTYLEAKDLHGGGAALDAVMYPLESVKRLGKLKRVRIDLIEGMSRSPARGKREWTEAPRGLEFETFIHVLVLSKKLLAQSGKCWQNVRVKTVQAASSTESVIPNAITFMRVDACVDDVKLTLSAGKYADERSLTRGGIAEYENGTIVMDFDAMTAAIAYEDGARSTIGVKSQFSGSYGVQASLVSKFFEEGWADARFDDFDDQAEVLKWLVDNLLTGNEVFRYGNALPNGFSLLHEALQHE